MEVTLGTFPPAVPGTDLSGTVVAVKPAGGTPIPPGGAVLVARGTSAGRLASEAPVDQRVTVRLILRPQWAGVVDAVGGGPLIVRDGRPVFRALEDFTSDQLSLRNPRTAVGQQADGGIILVAVDGRQPGTAPVSRTSSWRRRWSGSAPRPRARSTREARRRWPSTESS